ncbi:hypothetical protein [Methylobacterium sp. J-067]|uniref:hypothetical protein n=1 Tax=Methylobacterium sp. J-067 TaxID=2836648 RepID=UPI001FB88193|nr:hypothetical protein [Methylobacterium sp. J-067]MCJ2023160.1 hypothetical protein [Methylobacterium sp. J-067]
MRTSPLVQYVTMALIAGIGMSSPSLAECAKLVASAANMKRASWSEIESFEAPKSLNPKIDIVQTIKGTGQGKLNIDQYSIAIDKNGQEPKSLLNEIRRNLSGIVFNGSSYTNVTPLDADSKKLWESDNYKGSIIVFTLASIPNVMDLETGAVVVSCQSDTDFLVSTVKVGSANTYSSPGWHPVSGNRAFGVRQTGDNSLTIFVKASDRIVNAGIFKTVLPNEFVFTQGSKVWMNMLDNLKAKYASRNPRDAASFSQRVDY